MLYYARSVKVERVPPTRAVHVPDGLSNPPASSTPQSALVSHITESSQTVFVHNGQLKRIQIERHHLPSPDIKMDSLKSSKKLDRIPIWLCVNQHHHHHQSTIKTESTHTYPGLHSVD